MKPLIITILLAASVPPGSTLLTTASIASDTAGLELANHTAQGSVYVGNRGYLPSIQH